MKKSLLVVIIVVGLIALAWRARHGDAEPVVAEGTPATEVSVHAAKIVRTTLRGYVTAYGTVAAEPASAQAAAGGRLAPAAPGVVVAVHVQEGQQVAKGAVLFELDSRAADITVTFARKTLERQRQLIAVGGTSPKALQQAEQQLDDALVQQALLRVLTPLSGTVTRVNVRPGEAVDLMTVMAEVVDLDRLVVNASVPIAEWRMLKLGRPAEILDTSASEPIRGVLNYIGADADAANGTVSVRVGLSAGATLRPGQFVAVRIVSAEHVDRLAVPLASIARDEDGATVVAVIENDIALQRPVTTGLRDGGLVEIEADGLRAGMTVVTQGAYALPRQTRVRVLDN